MTTPETLADRLARCVKPLAWHNFDVWTWWAESPSGTYHVEERNGYWQVELRVGGLVHHVFSTDDTTPEDMDAAQAAAQADYTARILAALDLDALAREVEAIVGDGVRAFVAGLTEDSNVSFAMRQRICCNGQDCGCMGADVQSYLEWIASPPPSAPAPTNRPRGSE